jgi:precorrin-2 dehydrogenase/sirohydrochlorin ferrochelatase
MRMSGRESGKGVFPVMLNLEGKRCVIAGGGRVAERRAGALLAAGALVRIISPEATSAIRGWAENGDVEYVAREYAAGDLDDPSIALVFVATNRPEVNRRIAEDARRRGLWVNTADEGQRGDFLVPAVVRRGPLVFAVSASGNSPLLAAAIKSELESAYGEEYAAYVQFLGEIRDMLRERRLDPDLREKLLRELLRLKPQLLASARAGNLENMRDELVERWRIGRYDNADRRETD